MKIKDWLEKWSLEGKYLNLEEEIECDPRASFLGSDEEFVALIELTGPLTPDEFAFG